MQDESEASEEQTYFRAIEETFIRLRGAPMLLSPADWQAASRWHGAGIPLELVQGALEEVFTRRRARGARGRVQSLSYCEDAVLAAWQEWQEMTAAGQRRPATDLEVGDRLAALARSLPDDLPQRGQIAQRILGLKGDTEAVELGLAALDTEMLRSIESRLSAEERQLLSHEAQKALESLARRLSERQIEQARTRLFRQLLRRQRGLPVLSLFSPEANPEI